MTANIFLRELRGIWERADPPLQELAAEAAVELGLTKRKIKDEAERLVLLRELQNLWSKKGVKNVGFVDFEAALVRYGKDVLRKRSSKLAG